MGFFILFFNVKSLLRTSISFSHSSLIHHFTRKRGAQDVHRWVWLQTIASCSGAISGPLWPDQGSASQIHLFFSVIVFKKISSCTAYRDRKMTKMYLWGPNQLFLSSPETPQRSHLSGSCLKSSQRRRTPETTRLSVPLKLIFLNQDLNI